MAGTPTFKFYLSDGDTKKTITENHPKLDARGADFQHALEALGDAYDLPGTEVGLTSETTVYTAS